jgi:hypothetical protein
VATKVMGAAGVGADDGEIGDHVGDPGWGGGAWAG